MNWRIKERLQFGKERKLIDGYCHFGFHNPQGTRYILDHDTHWVGEIATDTDTLNWTAGNQIVREHVRHIYADILNPTYITFPDKETVIVASSGNNKVFAINPAAGEARLLIDGAACGFKDIGNCEYDSAGFLWINEVTGCRVHKFDLKGNLMTTLGTGEPGFQAGTVSFTQVQFNWIYDLRRGADGNLYVLDSKNYCVRKIDPVNEEVTVIAGTGRGGYTGDGGSALQATFGSSSGEHFDGPWSLSLDEASNLYIGDTQNHVVRRVDHSSGIITTIAGTPHIVSPAEHVLDTPDLFSLQLPRICSLDYYDGQLFVPEWDGELIILENCP
ncbi:hypothetical protein [Paenibacillus sp. FSL M7-1046]|uniref:hypothetical protein n=1 Tax=Paenibacillus sp. FSL M7-1046 TaxID=2975315 RepID=UPI0030FC8720